MDIPIHHEYHIPHEKGHALLQRVFAMMKQLDGWCSDEKAEYLVELIRLTKPDVVVEIGVFGGKSLLPMAMALKANHKGMAFGIDPWSHDASSVGMEGENLNWWSNLDHEKILKLLQERIKLFNLQDYITLVRATSLDAEPIEGIGLLHIDGNHSEETSYIDVTKWVPYVKSGGIIIFDDVNWSTTDKAVSWLNTHCIPFAEIHGENIWGAWIKP